MEGGGSDAFACYWMTAQIYHVRWNLGILFPHKGPFSWTEGTCSYGNTIYNPASERLFETVYLPRHMIWQRRGGYEWSKLLQRRIPLKSNYCVDFCWRIERLSNFTVKLYWFCCILGNKRQFICFEAGNDASSNTKLYSSFIVSIWNTDAAMSWSRATETGEVMKFGSSKLDLLPYNNIIKGI